MQRIHPAPHLVPFGDAAQVQHRRQQTRGPDRRQMPAGEVAADGTVGQADRPRNVVDGEASLFT
jgi:hypothetical protein